MAWQDNMPSHPRVSKEGQLCIEYRYLNLTFWRWQSYILHVAPLKFIFRTIRAQTPYIYSANSELLQCKLRTFDFQLRLTWAAKERRLHYNWGLLTKQLNGKKSTTKHQHVKNYIPTQSKLHPDAIQIASSISVKLHRGSSCHDIEVVADTTWR